MIGTPQRSAMMKPAILLVLFVWLAAACSPDPAPSATIESVTPDQLMPSDDTRDDLTIALRYDDGDGDLGGGVAAVYDCRAADVVIELAIPAIAADRGLHITGTLELHVNDIGAIASTALPRVCADLGVAALAANTAVFCVVLVDVAGHHGGGDCTKPIELAPP
jgi:hypothetical protein